MNCFLVPARWVASHFSSALRQGSRTTTSFLQSTLRMTDVESIGTTKVNSVSELKNLFVFSRGTNNNIVGASHNFGHSQPQPHPNRGQIYFSVQRSYPQDISHLCAQTGSHNFMCFKLGYIHMCHICNIVSLLYN